MEWTNAPVSLSGLPAAADIALQPIDTKYLKVLRIEWVITTIVLGAAAVGLIFLIPSLWFNKGWIIVAGTWLLIAAVHRLLLEMGFRYNAYAIRDKDLVSQKGWIFRTRKICPNNRIQNCTVHSGPIERRFGLASLIVYSAGPNNADISISGLLLADAERLRHFILETIHSEHDAAI